MKIKINFAEAFTAKDLEGLDYAIGEIEDEIVNFNKAITKLQSSVTGTKIDCGGNVRISIEENHTKIYKFKNSKTIFIRCSSRKALVEWLQQKVNVTPVNGSNSNKQCEITTVEKDESKPGEWKILTWSLQVGKTNQDNGNDGKAWSEEIVEQIVKKHDVCFFQEVLIGNNTKGIKLDDLKTILTRQGFDCYPPKPIGNLFTLLTAVRKGLIHGIPDIVPISYKCEEWASCHTRALILKYNDVQLINIHLPANQTENGNFLNRKNDRIKLMKKINLFTNDKFTWLAGDFNCADSTCKSVTEKLDDNLTEAKCLISKLTNKLSIHKNVLKTSYHRWFNKKLKQKQIDYICSTQEACDLEEEKILCCTVFGLKKPRTNNEGVHNPVSNIFWKEKTCIVGTSRCECSIDSNGEISLKKGSDAFKWKQDHLSHQNHQKAFQRCGDIKEKPKPPRKKPWLKTGNWSWNW